MRDDPQLFRQFADNLPSSPAIDLIYCPDCKSVTERETTCNGLTKWAYKQESFLDKDKDGRLRTRYIYVGHTTRMCKMCRSK